MSAAAEIEKAIRVVFAQSRSLAERSTLATSLGDSAAGKRLLDRANTLARTCQYLEADLGRRIVSGVPPVGVAGIQPVVVRPREEMEASIASDIGSLWCDQCDDRVSRKKADFCHSKFCPVRA